jgi:sarcosine oxidase/L-pipecolate oxidase
MFRPTGDFIVSYHPGKKSLFIATGGSGHAFKFLPVIGEHIADLIERKPNARFKEKWAWPEKTVEEVITLDGSRGGITQLPLPQMLANAQLKL